MEESLLWFSEVSSGVCISRFADSRVISRLIIAEGMMDFLLLGQMTNVK